MNYKLAFFYLLNYVLIFFAFLPNKLSLINFIYPAVELMFIFFFYIYRQSNLSYLFILFIAILTDTILENIIGTTAIMYFLLLLIFPYQLKIFFFKSFKEIWLAFSIFCFEFFLIEAFFNNFINRQSPDLNLLFFKFGLTISLYPVVHFLYLKLSNLLLEKKYA